MKNFAIIGAAGYIAPRHMRAIKDTGNNLVAALDKHDNVGILDSYFPDCDFFTEIERFDRHIDKLRRNGVSVDFVSICSPNYLHDSHIRFALKHGANAICEKPLVLNPWNIDGLAELESFTGRKVYTILQLRLQPDIMKLRDEIRSYPSSTIFDVELHYITARGRWYNYSWKGDVSKSGGVSTNIGIHFFDVLIWIFGNVKSLNLESRSGSHSAGLLVLERARVKWRLSIDANDLPPACRAAGKRTYRSLLVGNKIIEFSEGFTDLHTQSYQGILNGNGFGLNEARPSIEIAHSLRSIERPVL